MKNEAVKITMRHEPCRCGCRGEDPWHAKTVTRVLRDRVEVDECDDRGFRTIERAKIKMPWGLVAVKHITYGQHNLGWKKDTGA